MTGDLFTPLRADEKKSEGLSYKHRPYWQLVLCSFIKHKTALIALCLLAVLAFFTIFGPSLCGYDFSKQIISERNQFPSVQHWFGTDALGRDIFARVWVASRISFFIGIVGTALVITVGIIYGGFAGYFGGRLDMLMMRIIEILGSVPYLIIVILLALILGKGLTSLLIAMSITGWINTARIVRGQVLSLKNEEYVRAAQVLGASPWRIITKHLLANTLSLIIVNISFTIPGFIFGEAFLSFIGLGIQTPNTSLGAEINSGFQNLQFYPFQVFFPGVVIAAIMLAFTLIGDGLRDAMDPKLRR